MRKTLDEFFLKVNETIPSKYRMIFIVVLVAVAFVLHWFSLKGADLATQVAFGVLVAEVIIQFYISYIARQD